MSHRRLLSVFVSSVLAASVAQAQQAEAPDTSAQLEEITVTATKRAESLQAVPVAVTVLSGAQLEQGNFNTLSAITSQVPTLNFRANASNKDTAMFIRGVGTISTVQGVEPTVATVIDGVVYARPGQTTLDLMDVERIEVLRGPQGTLFGKNASAGVVNIVSKRISPEPAGSVDIAYYEGNERRIRGAVSGKLGSESVLGALNVMYGEFDGNMRNIALNTDMNGYERKGARGKLQIAASENVDITLIGDYTQSDDTGSRGAWQRPTATQALAIAPIVARPDNRDVSTTILERVEDRNYGASLQIDWGMGTHTLTSITAYRKWKNTQFQDLDGTPVVYAQLLQQADKGIVDSDQISEELRIASPTGQFVEYVAGLFYYKNKVDEVYRRDLTRCATNGTPLPNGLTPCATLQLDNGVATYGFERESVAAFGEATLNFTSAFRGILGARYNSEDVSYYHSRASTVTAAVGSLTPSKPLTTGDTSDDAVSGRAGIQYDINDDVMAYATYSRGYKGQAYNAFFNMQPVIHEAPLDPEESDSYEIGLKTTLFDNRLRLNLAAFDAKYKGFQANNWYVVGTSQPPNYVYSLINAGDVTTQGFEADFQAKLTPDFSLSGALAYTDAHVDQFLCPPGGTPTQCNIPSGTMLPFAPEWKYNVRFDYNIPLSGKLEFALGADYSYQTETQYDLNITPTTLQPAYGIVNAWVTLANPDSGWRLTFLGKNLADQSYANNFLPNGTQRSVPRDDQRYFGVNLRWDF